MRTTSWLPYHIVLLFSLFVSQRVSSTVDKKQPSLGAKNNPSDPHIAAKEENHNASGNLDSCLKSRQEEKEGGVKQISVEMGDETASKAGTDVDTAPTSLVGRDEEAAKDSRKNRGEDGYIPERYIVGCGGDRVEAARRWGSRRSKH